MRWGWYHIGVPNLYFLCPACASERAEQGRCDFVEERGYGERVDCHDCGAELEAAA